MGDGAGRVFALFSADTDGDGTSDALLAGRFAEGRWEAPERVAAGSPVAEPRLLALRDGALLVAWWGHVGAAPGRAPTAILTRVRTPDGRWSRVRAAYLRPDGEPVPVLALRGTKLGARLLHSTRARGLVERPLAADGSPGAETRLGGDGHSARWSADGGTLAYVAQRVSPERPQTVNDVYVRIGDGGAPGPEVEVWHHPDRYSHGPVAATAAGGRRHLFWLQDVDGGIEPERIWYAWSDGGARWSAPRDVTPPALNGRIPWSLDAESDGGGGVELTVHYTAPDMGGSAVHRLRVDGSGLRDAPLVPAGELGPGAARLAAAAGAVHALWRGADGRYRHAVLAGS